MSDQGEFVRLSQRLGEIQGEVDALKTAVQGMAEDEHGTFWVPFVLVAVALVVGILIGLAI